VVLFFFCFASARAGKILDLSHEDLSSGIYSLNGEWEFYWNQTLTPTDFRNSTITYESIVVPGAWNRQLNYPAQGFATYRIIVRLPENSTGLAIYFPVINSAARIWINGELVTEVGNATTDMNQFKPKLSGTTIEVPPNEFELELTVFVVNYNYFVGGFSGSPQIGKISQVISKQNQTYGIENFFAGSLFAMFIYQVILYLLYQRGKPHLWLSLICLGVALRALIVHGGSFLLPNLFPSVSWEIWKKIEFGSVYAISAFFPLYIYDLFPDHAPKWPLWFFGTIASMLCLIVLITSQHIYGRLLELDHVSLLLAFGYAIYSVGNAWKNSNKDARLFFMALLFLFRS
jgi:hypothetical protein